MFIIFPFAPPIPLQSLSLLHLNVTCSIFSLQDLKLIGENQLSEKCLGVLVKQSVKQIQVLAAWPYMVNLKKETLDKKAIQLMQ